MKTHYISTVTILTLTFINIHGIQDNNKFLNRQQKVVEKILEQPHFRDSSLKTNHEEIKELRYLLNNVPKNNDYILICTSVLKKRIKRAIKKTRKLEQPERMIICSYYLRLQNKLSAQHFTT